MQRMRLAVMSMLLVVAVCGCAGSPAPQPTQTETTIKAVYLVPPAGGQLAAADLAAHPEVKVVHDMASLRQAATTRTALWVDAGCLEAADWAWIARRGSELYPVVLVGRGNAGTLNGKLELKGIYPGGPVQGFSVWIVPPQDGTPSTLHQYLMRGYPEPPTAGAILKLTNPALEGRYPWLQQQ